MLDKMVLLKSLYATVVVLVIACIVRFAWQRILKLVKGKWIHEASNNQTWTYKFKSNYEVHFSIDHQITRWLITDMEASGDTVRIWVNDPGVKAITITKSSDDAVVISSCLHPAIRFTR